MHFKIGPFRCYLFVEKMQKSQLDLWCLQSIYNPHCTAHRSVILFLALSLLLPITFIRNSRCRIGCEYQLIEMKCQCLVNCICVSVRMFVGLCILISSMIFCFLNVIVNHFSGCNSLFCTLKIKTHIIIIWAPIYACGKIKIRKENCVCVCVCVWVQSKHLSLSLCVYASVIIRFIEVL